MGPRGPLGRWTDDDAGGPAAPGPLAAAERDAWIVLATTDGVGPVTFGRLVEAFGSAAAVLEAARGRDGGERMVAASRPAGGGWPSLGPGVAASLADRARDPALVLDAVRRAGVLVVVPEDAAYPRRLRSIELPPPVLFVRGDPAALDRDRAVAVVGTRRPTGHGRDTASAIGEAVAAAGATVVSGLAYGIDAAAHVASVRAGTPTVAVIGGGHDRLYPAAHARLARSIVDGGGAVVSEFAPDTPPTRGTFPRRNRIISGLSDAVVVVEAGARSGALTTAAWALEQGRGLHLVPGRLDDPAVAGCLAFLREAGPEARIVAGIAELLEDLALVPDATAARVSDGTGNGSRHTGLSGVEQALLAALAAGRTTVDELVLAAGEAPATVLGALTSLETRGLVIELFGRYRTTGPEIARRRRMTATSPGRTAAGIIARTHRRVA